MNRLHKLLIRWNILPDPNKVIEAAKERARINRKLNDMQARLRMNDIELRTMQRRK